ncbi:helix-turn-helix protein [Streptomyces sp. Amel2xB2]|uniref:helix-turn-helix domain-containing protein n=1 Tax=Streptomyces sp. Amel2xB2 TaxID=1305829 RepID=UPI000DBA3D93|nr:helix-turn-helix transcriptional regulator [Streptomyces sp. Amel2xB2]RAJ70197.1 helix-turn-helix protein [Streptomyces sp. Amel2xB2]
MGNQDRANRGAPDEDLAQLIAAIREAYDINESEVARRLGVHASTVNNWTNRRRGSGRGPNPATLRKISSEFPKFPEKRVFAAARRLPPAPLTPDAKERLLNLFDELTEEQQASMEAQVRAVVEINRQGGGPRSS